MIFWKTKGKIKHMNYFQIIYGLTPGCLLRSKFQSVQNVMGLHHTWGYDV